ncbi:MAG: hypothetical protein WCE63_10815 [Acidobacteriaceae bacterium]
MAGTIFLIAGPSGSGKTTLTQELVRRVTGLTRSGAVCHIEIGPEKIRSGLDGFRYLLIRAAIRFGYGSEEQ